MGRGSSKAGGGGGGKPLANTPSGVTYDQFMQMTEQEKFQTMDSILANPNIQVPNYLDDSDVSKVMYGLGMNNKPTVVSDAQLDTMPGKELYRTVYESGVMPPPSSDAILDQIKNGDFTQMSGRNRSVHGRALYFATDFTDSTVYGSGERNAQVMRAKINPNAKIVSESNLINQMSSKAFSNSVSHSKSMKDDMGLYALSQGIDGWYSGTYTMIVNRGNLTASSQNKTIKSGRGMASSWATANNAK